MPTSPDPRAAIASRLDRLSAQSGWWKLVLLISLGAIFEMYDLFLTAYLAPGLVRSGLFHAEGTVFWGLSSQATFAAVTFGGLFVGTLVLSAVADRYGRRAIFSASLLGYTAATLVMAAQTSAAGLYAWRFVAGVGIGVQLVTIDAYIAELVPRQVRTRAFAFSAFVEFLGVPAAALLATVFIDRSPLGIAGWRWVVLASAAGALVVWLVRRQVPESPRWLAARGRFAEAQAALELIERRFGAGSAAGPAAGWPEPAGDGPAPARGFRPGFGGYRGRIAMLVVFQFFQTIGFYGFGNWLPTLLAQNGASTVHSLEYSFAIALAYPVGPLLCLGLADAFEPKWQIVAASLAVAAFGLVFSWQSAAAGIIGFGILVTFSNCAMSYAYHAYQTELFPTRIRARAVGFCYSWSRFSTIVSSYLVAFFLARFGTPGVFAFIASSMGIVAVVIGGFGPPTRGRALEETALG